MLQIVRHKAGSRKVAQAPDYQGVYAIRLARGSYEYTDGRSKLVYVGEAHADDSSIKKRLSAHFVGAGDADVFSLLERRIPLQVRWKRFADPAAAETRLLVAFLKRFGALPCANDRIEWSSLHQPKRRKKVSGR